MYEHIHIFHEVHRKHEAYLNKTKEEKVNVLFVFGENLPLIRFGLEPHISNSNRPVNNNWTPTTAY